MFLRDNSDILDRTAIVDGYGNCATYGELERKTSEYAQMIPCRSLIMILCDYSFETVVFYYCMMNHHAVPILLDKALDKDLVNKLIQCYQPEYIWAESGCYEEEYSSKAKVQNHEIYYTEFKPANMHENLALLLTTSGSTGSPKLVRISYDNLISNAQALVEKLDLREDDRAVTTLPFHYCYGLSVMHMHWIKGAGVYITGQSLLRKEFWDFFVQYKITNFAGVPYSYKILRQINFLDHEYPFLRFMTQAGGKLAEEQQKFWGQSLLQKGIRFYILYGQTEGTTVLTGIPHMRILDKIGSIGLPLPGIQAGIHMPDEWGKGELMFQCTSVSMGYAVNRMDLAQGDVNRGVLYTGDLASMDEEGYIFLKGRIKRFVKLLGIRVSLDDLESILNNQFKENEIACLGEDDLITIYIAGIVSSDVIEKFCEEKYRIKKRMLNVHYIDKIPRNSSGKILYKTLEHTII